MHEVSVGDRVRIHPRFIPEFSTGSPWLTAHDGVDLLRGQPVLSRHGPDVHSRHPVIILANGMAATESCCDTVYTLMLHDAGVHRAQIVKPQVLSVGLLLGQPGLA